MQFLPLTMWQVAFEQITKRYEGRNVTLRQAEFGQKEPLLILWLTPLRHINLSITPPNRRVTIFAGQLSPFIEVQLGPIVQVRLQLASDQSLQFLRFYSSDGSIYHLAFHD